MKVRQNDDSYEKRYFFCGKGGNRRFGLDRFWRMSLDVDAKTANL